MLTAAVKPGENSEHKLTVLPFSKFNNSRRSTRRHKYLIGERVILLSLTSDGWIHSGFRGVILSLLSVKDRRGRQCSKAQVAWDKGVSHPAHIGIHALSRLRPE